MEKQNQKEIGVDFTTRVPREIITKIIFHAIKPEEDVLIKKNLKELVNFSQVNKFFYQLIRKNNALSIQKLAKFFKITDRAIVLHLTNLGAIKTGILEKYPYNEELTAKLIDAFKKNDELAITSLIQQNANIDCKINFYSGYSPLIYAAKNKKTTLAQKQLIDAGADLNRKDEEGWTALMYACVCKNIHVAQLLIDAGADIHLKNHYMFTALDIAILRNYTAIIELLQTKKS
ncbi:MAG: ankyrin repeat domain-containing protein [Candidatus Dependentiae bacterium]|nr:ankyrin repeat domain-containing protein [Candidatus Dependentiae bacterium]